NLHMHLEFSTPISPGNNLPQDPLNAGKQKRSTRTPFVAVKWANTGKKVGQ
ncbi:hypothetical protein FRC11_014338, partial [Ceratobasidium sp. 423]